MKTIDIQAPVEKVFERCDDPNAFPLYVPNVARVTNVQLTDGRIGDTFRVTYKMMGGYFNQDITYTEYERNRRIGQRTEGTVTGIMSMTLEPQDKLTKATFESEFEMAGNFLRKVMNRIVLERANEKNAEQMLENLKKLCETS